MSGPVLTDWYGVFFSWMFPFPEVSSVAESAIGVEGEYDCFSSFGQADRLSAHDRLDGSPLRLRT